MSEWLPLPLPRALPPLFLSPTPFLSPPLFLSPSRPVSTVLHTDTHIRTHTHNLSLYFFFILHLPLVDKPFFYDLFFLTENLFFSFSSSFFSTFRNFQRRKSIQRLEKFWGSNFLRKRESEKKGQDIFHAKTFVQMTIWSCDISLLGWSLFNVLRQTTVGDGIVLFPKWHWG